MRTKTSKRRATPEQVEAAKARRATLMDQVQAFEAEIEAGNADAALLAALARFMAKYSARNAALIVMQDPEATDVAGFVDWQKRGRVVRKGQTGIKILAPAGSREAIESRPATDTSPAVEGEPARQFFKLATVFDIRQTDELVRED